MAKEVINILPIVLEWSDWTPWDNLKIDARYGGGVKVPNGEPGIYEAKYRNSEERLHIGKTKNLRRRVKQLVKGKHQAGSKMRPQEELSKLVVRWAITDRPAAVEEELHKRHRDKFGKLPKYDQQT